MLADTRVCPSRLLALDRGADSRGRSISQEEPLLLVPTAAQAAEWIVLACEAQRLTGAPLRKCAETVLDYLNNQNNLQFVIAGVITEPNIEGYFPNEKADAAFKQIANANVLYSFRDGNGQIAGTTRHSFRAARKAAAGHINPPILLRSSWRSLQRSLTLSASRACREASTTHVQALRLRRTMLGGGW